MRSGWALAKQSFGVLRTHRGLLSFPLLGALAAMVILVAACGVGLAISHSSDRLTAPTVVLAVIGLYLVIFVGYFFSVGLVAAADEMLRGGQATLRDGLRVSSERAGLIAGWALLSTTVGVVFSAIEEIDIVGPIIGNLLDAAWTLITFVALPVIVIEGTGPFETVRRSGRIFKERWAGQVTGNIGIFAIVFVLGILPSLAVGVAGYLLLQSSDGGAGDAGGAALIALGAILLVISYLTERALSGIFSVALYRYATEDTALGGFSAEQLESAVGAPRGRVA